MAKTPTKAPVKKTAAPDKKNLVSTEPLTPVLPAPTSDLSPKKMSTPEELFLSDLRDMYWSELHLVKAIPKMVDAASNEDLRSALAEHLDITRGHVSRLEQAFDILQTPKISKKCAALEGLVISGEHTIENTLVSTPARETGLIDSGLKVENFEITCYTGMIRSAQALGLIEVSELLTANLEEEQEASVILTALAAQQ